MWIMIFLGLCANAGNMEQKFDHKKQKPNTSLQKISKICSGISGKKYNMLFAVTITAICGAVWNKYRDNRSIAISESDTVVNNEKQATINLDTVPMTASARDTMIAPSFYAEEISKRDYKLKMNKTPVGIILTYVEDLNAVVSDQHMGEFMKIVTIFKGDLSTRGLDLVQNILNTQYFTLLSYPEALTQLQLNTNRSDYDNELSIFTKEQENLILIFNVLAKELQAIYDKSLELMAKYNAFEYMPNGDMHTKLPYMWWYRKPLYAGLKTILSQAAQIFQRDEFKWGLAILTHYPEIHEQAAQLAPMKKQKWLKDNAHKLKR